MRILIILILTIITFTSCKQENSGERIKSIMGDWYKKRIEFPEGMELVNKSIQMDSKKQPFSIVHFFTADCDKCVHELLSIQKFIQKHKDQQNVNYVFIASGPTKLYVQEAVEQSGFALPVYYEKEYFSFKKMNHLPVADKLFDTMLLNSKQEVILFGELFQNKKAEDLFYHTINYSK